MKAELATYEEIQHLANRRALSVERRERLFRRAEERFDRYVAQDFKAYQEGKTRTVGTTFKLAVVPRFPVTSLKEELELLKIARTIEVEWRRARFPAWSDPVTQHESAILLQPFSYFSMLELSTWGQVFFALEVEREDQARAGRRGVYLVSLLGHLLCCLEHARVVHSALGYDGTLRVRLKMEHARGRPFLMENAPLRASRLDDTIEFALDAMSDRLRDDRDGIATDVIRRLFFAAGWADLAASEGAARRTLLKGYEYNIWPPPSPES